MAPATLAPGLFKLAFRKLSVKDALPQGKWMRGLERMISLQDLEDFAKLWEKVREIQLTDRIDTVTWILTTDAAYSAKSAYEVQFYGRLVLPDLNNVWKVKMEEKVRFFLWLLLQNRLWTADRLRNRGWNHDDKCCLCLQVLETADHLILQCPFAKEV
ncbi:hypothetical protein ACQ4PT_060405 [Festuca glaucescens]